MAEAAPAPRTVGGDANKHAAVAGGSRSGQGLIKEGKDFAQADAACQG